MGNRFDIHIGSRTPPGTDYVLGYGDSEHDRLIRHATLLAAITEQFFRGAAIASHAPRTSTNRRHA